MKKLMLGLLLLVGFNISGQKVLDEQIDKRLKHTFVHELPKGVYFVHVSLVDGSKEKIKIIVP